MEIPLPLPLTSSLFPSPPMSYHPSVCALSLTRVLHGYRWEIVYRSKENLVATPLKKMIFSSTVSYCQNTLGKGWGLMGPLLVYDEISYRQWLHEFSSTKDMSGSEDDFYAGSLPHPAFTSFHCLFRDALWAFELVMQLASLPRAKSLMVNFSQHFDQVKVSALNGVCFSKKLSRWRQCTAPILNDELGLGPRVTLPESLLCDTAGSVWVWLSPNSAIISFNLSGMRLRLKDIEWLCPIHQIRRDRWTRLMKAST